MERLNILVTGGVGFVGSHLVDALVAKAIVCGSSIRLSNRFTAGGFRII